MAESAYPTELTGPSHHVQIGQDGRRLVLFFGAKDLAIEHFNFFQLGRELPDTLIFLNNGANDWYQYGIPGFGDDFDSSVATLKQWQEAVGATEICTVGTSMGAYGAIQYGAALGARVLSFATDTVLNALHTQSAQHFIGTQPPSCPDLRALLPDYAENITLLVGERDPVDLYSAWQLQQEGPINVISLIGADHIVPTFLSRRARLGPLLRAFVNGKKLPDQPDAGRAIVTKGYCEAIFTAHDAAIERNWPTVEIHARAALERYPYGEAASLLLGRALLQQEHYEDAIVWLASAVASAPNDYATQTQLAAAYRHLGGDARARQIHTQILAQNPGYHPSHFALGIIKLTEGDLAGADKSVRRALRIAPTSKAYKSRLKNITARIAAAKKKS